MFGAEEMTMFDMNGILLMVVIFGLSMAAQGYLTRTYGKFSKIRNARDITGAEVARDILDSNGLHNVRIEMAPGFLSDHYDPIHKVVRLSEANYSSPSLAALAVAAHEVGHAIQDAKAYTPLIVRARLAGPLSAVANLGQMALFAGLLFIASSFGQTMLLIGIIGMAAMLVFHLVTLPVEFDASKRALAILQNNGYLSQAENAGAKQVLNAAAMTYVIAAVSSALQLLYYLGFLRGGSDE
jgi:uncharacterized protein